MDVSIIYVNYKSKDLVNASLESVKKFTSGVEYEIIVVDNNSDDSIKECLSKDIKFIQAGDNLGFGRANNLGASVASGKYLFLLNGDTLLKCNALKIFFDYMENNPSVGVCGGNLVDLNGNHMYSFKIKMPNLRQIFMTEVMPQRLVPGKYFEKLKYNDTNKVIEVGFISGADFFVRRDVFDQVGGFDKEFFLYCEEVELCHRIHKSGYKIVNVPAVEIVHLDGASMKVDAEFNPRRFEWMTTRSQYLFFSKVYGNFSVKVYQFLILLGINIRNGAPHSAEKKAIMKRAYKEWKTEKKAKKQ